MKALIALAAIAGIGGGGYLYSQTYGFDYANASPDARKAYLERQIGWQEGTFKPNYLSRFTSARASSRGLTFTYNTGMGSVTCGHKVNCLEKFCTRYSMTSLAKNEITVNVVMTDNNGRQIGQESVSPRICKRFDR